MSTRPAREEYGRIARSAVVSAAAARCYADAARAVAGELTTSTRRAAQLREYAAFEEDVADLFDALAREAVR